MVCWIKANWLDCRLFLALHFFRRKYSPFRLSTTHCNPFLIWHRLRKWKRATQKHCHHWKQDTGPRENTNQNIVWPDIRHRDPWRSKARISTIRRQLTHWIKVYPPEPHSSELATQFSFIRFSLPWWLLDQESIVVHLYCGMVYYLWPKALWLHRESNKNYWMDRTKDGQGRKDKGKGLHVPLAKGGWLRQPFTFFLKNLFLIRYLRGFRMPYKWRASLVQSFICTVQPGVSTS